MKNVRIHSGASRESKQMLQPCTEPNFCNSNFCQKEIKMRRGSWREKELEKIFNPACERKKNVINEKIFLRRYATALGYFWSYMKTYEWLMM